ncbi:MAG: 16S rRNA (guanine(966)-N(2))-methyltransferase RsmD [Candidatus Solibacter sp.]|jgi:16S rRNA (guanine(966)-N(2))-methyltransferase RsmD
MRVIAGQFRSRRLESIPGDATRPTADRVREALFNILQTRISGASFVDAYAGTGAVGIEALSRGAAHAWFLERDRRALDAIRKNLASLGVERRATILAGKVLVTLERCPAGIVFLDPPYGQADEYTGALELLGVHPPALAIAQHSIHLKLKDAYGALHRTRMVKHGDNALSFYAA